MSSSFDLRPDHFLAGTVGPPGRRVFYLQARQGAHVVSLRLEKQQVAALAEYLAGILADLPSPEPSGGASPGLLEPVVAEWSVGSLAVAYEETDDRVLIVAEELVAAEGEDTPDTARDPDERPATARFHVTREQVDGFVRHAVELVLAGRPACPLCGHAMDPEGHVCPKSNGHRSP